MKLLLSHEQILEIADKMGKDITHYLHNEKKAPVLLCVMKGAMNFMVDLMHHIKMDVLVDYIQVTSFSGTESLGTLSLVKDVSLDVKDRTVVLVDDVVDSGISCEFLKKHIAAKGAKDVVMACLIDKRAERKVPATADFYGMVLEEKAFLVGYGLDYFDLLRNYDSVYIAESVDVARWDHLLAH